MAAVFTARKYKITQKYKNIQNGPADASTAGKNRITKKLKMNWHPLQKIQNQDI